MLLNNRIPFSANEVQTHNEVLMKGIRSDRRQFDEGRKLDISISTKPGFALVKLGKTMVTAHTKASLIVPRSESPNRGKHLVKIYAPSAATRSQVDTFQTYFRLLWRNANAVEEDTLCVKNGEKVWSLESQLVINDDDGGLIDVCIIALYISLSQIRFPSFDPATGLLYPPSQRRTHKIAFTLRPISVTIGFIGDKVIVDPTLLELNACTGYSLFILTEHEQQVYLDSRRPQNIDEARELAIKTAKTWKSQINRYVEEFDAKLSCVGSSADFVGYTPNTVDLNEFDHNSIIEFPEFELWKRNPNENFIVDFFSFADENKGEIDTEGQTNENENWLIHSLMA